ncbi:tRNA(Ile)-lysidine synthase [Paractinoplanes abujensis]|uniref:tRNA(Ile)-lysidine synthase n=1 Tax=Paractinoplanes abujensis TaxID=882441 RepID=A0A7W7G6W4_9ACTN|nr:tRNA lysidine(34) synthetase TilS [Actinoplanes abujensis]MBB4696386.1 tRNA(Ile)-lysidine synthase [Actinoplanes abujensis]GID22380.1 tRNA(Ile)-lysidine synthase [Actinoplanes abujensis]
MARIPPAVAAVRLAVRRALPADGGLVLVACSGGADSLALAAAARFVGRSVGLVTVDHGLQAGSASRAADVATWAAEAGFTPVGVETVTVAGLPGGPEAAARTARYGALEAYARRVGAAVVLLGHTRDDQAETVLLALARGAGPRGLSGMPARNGLFVRPLLDVARADTRKACAALGLTPWEDPHNSDPAFARSRVRGKALPALIEALGPAVVANLARSAAMIAADNEALDTVAAEALRLSQPSCLEISDLLGMRGAVRRRVLHMWARELGAPGSALSHRHVEALDALVTRWRGQGAVHLPGGIQVVRERGTLVRVP